MNKYELLKINQDKKTNRQKRQKDNKPKYDEQDSENIKMTSNELLRLKRGRGWLGRAGAVSSRSFHLLNSMIYDLKDLQNKDDCLIRCYIYPQMILVLKESMKIYSQKASLQGRPFYLKNLLSLVQEHYIFLRNDAQIEQFLTTNIKSVVVRIYLDLIP